MSDYRCHQNLNAYLIKFLLTLTFAKAQMSVGFTADLFKKIQETLYEMAAILCHSNWTQDTLRKRARAGTFI